jgi:hypothetical protein
MNTEVTVEGSKIFINGRPTYKGKTYKGSSIEGLLFNSRMAQATFDDTTEDTRHHWVYPDTGTWDPDRNTNEFIQALPEYRKHGLLAVTVGLQGGGSIYNPETYKRYWNSAFSPEGDLVIPYFDRLEQILKKADELGMVVIVNYLYLALTKRMKSKEAVYRACQGASERLLQSGFTNIIVDIVNECADFWDCSYVTPRNVHSLIEHVKGVTRRGRRLLCGVSTPGGQTRLPTEAWLCAEDISFPHGNGCGPEELKKKLERYRNTPGFQNRPRPLIINEDSTSPANLEAAVEGYASWGFYAQGYGSGYRGDKDVLWYEKPRENSLKDLSGYQTVPVNWGINTERKKSFFNRLEEITSGEG